MLVITARLIKFRHQHSIEERRCLLLIANLKRPRIRLLQDGLGLYIRPSPMLREVLDIIAQASAEG